MILCKQKIYFIQVFKKSLKLMIRFGMRAMFLLLKQTAKIVKIKLLYVITFTGNLNIQLFLVWLIMNGLKLGAVFWATIILCKLNMMEM